MKEWTLEDLQEEYNLDFVKIIDLIKKENAKMLISKQNFIF